MELKVGMYVRTDLGEIGKVTSVSNEDMSEFGLRGQFYNSEPFLKGNEIKASENILDLIEPGDYVNGLPVVHNARDNGGNIVIVINGNAYNEKEIKSVVTKEQFDSVKYEVE